MWNIRTVHRFVTVVIVLVTLYLSATGTMIQLVDLRSIFTHAAADDPNVLAMREAQDGPGNYAVLAPKDYTAPSLPQGADLQGMLSRVMQSARMTVGGIPLRYVELRMADNKPVGIVESGGRLAQFDAVSGQIISAGPPPRPTAPPVSQFHQSTRNMFKVLHRMTLFGNYALFINVIVGVGLLVMITTGLIMYFRMLSGRSRSTSANPFWSGGGVWRTWHRRISILAAIFLMVVSLSGLWLAYESLYFGFYMGSATQRAAGQAFAAAQRQRLAALPVSAPRPDPMSAEAQPGRLASMQQDIGLTADEMVKVKAITDNSVKTNLELHRPDADPQAARAKLMSLHQDEANAIMAVLTDDEKPRFQAWRDAQLVGTPVGNGRPQNGAGQQNGGGQQRGGGQGGGRNQGAGGPGGGNRAPGSPGGGGANGGPGGANRALGGPNQGNQPGGASMQGGGNGGGNGGGGGGNGGGNADPFLPIQDADLSSMLGATLAAEQSIAPGTPIRVVRLRYYAGMPQGVVITGGDDTKQLVFNTSTQKPVSETEPGYPPAGFPFGWQAHQTAKNVHRGGVIGLPGRFMDLFAGLSMFYLSLSGIAIYFDLWRRRRKAGKSKLIWA